MYFDGIKVNKSVEVEALPTASSQDVIRECKRNEIQAKGCSKSSA